MEYREQQNLISVDITHMRLPKTALSNSNPISNIISSDKSSKYSAHTFDTVLLEFISSSGLLDVNVQIAIFNEILDLIAKTRNITVSAPSSSTSSISSLKLPTLQGTALASSLTAVPTLPKQLHDCQTAGVKILESETISSTQSLSPSELTPLSSSSSCTHTISTPVMPLSPGFPKSPTLPPSIMPLFGTPIPIILPDNKKECADCASLISLTGTAVALDTYRSVSPIGSVVIESLSPNTMSKNHFN